MTTFIFVRVMKNFSLNEEIGLHQQPPGQLIDASLVPVPKQRNSRKDNATIKTRGCPTEWKNQPTTWRQKNTDARWTVKHRENHYGYKNPVNVEKTHKLIRQNTVRDAAVHDSQVLEDLLLPANAGRGIWADLAYRSEAIEAQLNRRHLSSKIYRQGYPQKPLTTQQKAHNRGRSCIRARLEHVFGHQIPVMGGKLGRTIELLRTRLKIATKNLTFNFHRFLLLSAPPKALVT